MLSVNLLAMTFVSKLLIIHSTIFFIVSFRVTSFQSYRLFHCELLPYFSFGTVQNTNFARKGKNREIFMPAKLSYLEIFHGTFSFDYCCSTIITLKYNTRSDKVRHLIFVFSYKFIYLFVLPTTGLPRYEVSIHYWSRLFSKFIRGQHCWKFW